MDFISRIYETVRAVCHTVSDPLFWKQVGQVLQQVGPDVPSIDASTYVNNPMSPPKDYSRPFLARFKENPRVIAMEFGNYAAKSALDGISIFVEKYRKLEIPKPIEKMFGPVGNDLRLSDVADYYNFPRNKGQELNPYERELLDLLVARGLITLQRSPNSNSVSYRATDSAVALIAMSPGMDTEKRQITYVHEFGHALYFITDSVFQKKVSAAWLSLKPEARRFLEGALLLSGGALSNQDWLIKTEAQAYAIEPQIDGEGIPYLLKAAAHFCNSIYSAPAQCMDISLNSEDIKDLTTYIHQHYCDAVSDAIPLSAAYCLSKSPGKIKGHAQNAQFSDPTLETFNSKEAAAAIELARKLVVADSPQPWI